MTIQDYMRFIHSAIGGYYYDHNNGYEIMFTKQDNYWKLRKLKTELWQTFNADTSIETLNKHQLDLHRFQTSLRETVLTKANYYNMMLKKIELLVGKDALLKSFEDMDKFGDTLVKAITDVSRRQKISLVKDD